MKKLTVLFLFLIILASAGVKAQSFDYTSNYGYTVHVSGLWLQIPEETIVEKETYLRDNLNINVNYETGFYPVGGAPFAAPYMIIQYVGRNDNDFEKNVDAISSGKAVKEMAESLIEKNLIDSFDASNILVDRENKIIYQYSTMQSGDKIVKGVGAMMLGGTEVVQILFFDWDTDYNSNVSNFYNVVASYKPTGN